MQNILILPLLIIVFTSGVSAHAQSQAKITGEMLKIYSNPQPYWRPYPEKPEVSYVAKMIITDVVESEDNIKGWQIGNKKRDIVNIHNLSVVTPLSLKELPAKFTFRGLMKFEPPQDRRNGYFGIWSLRIQEIIKVIQKSKFEKAVLQPKWDEMKGKDPKVALAALKYLDDIVEKYMTEEDVQAIFPDGVFEKIKFGERGIKYYYVLTKEWDERRIKPNAWGGSGYAIHFDKNGKVIETNLLLGGDD